MFVKLLRKPVATATVVGGAVLIAGLGAPATAQPVHASPSAVVAAAQRPGCGYQGVVRTVTRLRLSSYVGRPGHVTVAHIRVSSGAGTPRGHVTLKVQTLRRFTRHLHHGSARVRFGRHLRARHTYSVTAHYPRQGCFGASSDTQFYTVLPRR